MSTKGVTLVIPIYNVEKYISKCLDSVEKQDFKDLAVWAVNDGSPDNSAEIVKEYQKKYSRIKLINKKNGGYGSVLEYCIDNISSEYFMICDPDDWLAPNAISELYNIAKNDNLDLVVGDRYHVYESDGTQEYVKTFDSGSGIIPRKIYTSDVDRFAYGLVSPHAKLFRTSVCRNIEFPKKVSYTDYVLYILSLARAKRAMYFNKAEAYYLIDRKGNTATNIDPSCISAYLKGWNAILDQLVQPEKNKGLLYRQYLQLKFIIGEYAKCSNNLFKDKYFYEILQAVSRFKSYKYLALKENIVHISRKDRLIYKLMLNKITSVFFVKIYVKYKRD